MATQEVVEAQTRPDSSRGKNEARRLRASGRIPATLYGAKQAVLAVSVDPKQISRILHSEAGHNTIFDVKVGSENSKVMVVDWQYDPLKGKL
ncbi:MAG: 50S ribosomal protein L25, partial [Candidatus Angelobacter sp.]